MMRAIGLVLAAVSTVCGVSVVPAVASAQFAFQEDGATAIAPFRATLHVTGPPHGTAYIGIRGPEISDNTQFSLSAEGTATIDFGVLDVGTFAVRIFDGAEIDIRGEFYVVKRAGPAPDRVKIERSTSETTFYPLVRDGLLDRFVMTFRSEAQLTAVSTVTNRRGQRLRVIKAPRASHKIVIVWNGRDAHSRKVPAGRYRIVTVVTALSPGGSRTKSTFTFRPTVKTEVVTSEQQAIRAGRATSSRRPSVCGYGYSNLYDALVIDCNGVGGRPSRTQWTFQIPERASKFRARVLGVTGCCNTGTKRVVTDVRRGRLMVTLLLGGHRSVAVTGVRVTFTIEQRI